MTLGQNGGIEELYVQHSGGEWWQQVNFITEVKGQYDENTIVREQVGVKLDRSSNLAVLCSIPFYVYGLSLGDTLIIDPRTYGVTGIFAKSGRLSYRVLFLCDQFQIDEITTLVKANCGVIFEFMDSTFCSVDLGNPELSTEFEDQMKSFQRIGLLDIESAVHPKYGIVV